MSKTKYLWLVILCTALTILFALWHLSTCMVGSLLLGGVFGAVYFRKHRRDMGYIEQGKAAQIESASQLDAPPAITSDDSIGLFVPSPLDRQS